MDSQVDQKIISVCDLKTILAEKPETILIDLLPPDHFASRHIPDAKNACVFQVSFLDDLAISALDKQTPIVVYGASQRSQDAAMALEKLDRAGYANASFLAGGLEAWCEAGYALEGETTQDRDDPQTTVTLLDGPYTVDAEASQIEWAGRNPNARRMGTVDITKGVVNIKEGTITGRVEIDMNTIKNIDLDDELQEVLEAHLRSDDFFFTKLFPKAVFTVKKATSIEPAWLTAPNYQVNGELSLRGVSAKIEFVATLAPLEGGAFVLEAHFDIDRTRWRVIYGSTRFFEHLGMHTVFDLISLQIRMVVVP